MTIGVAFVEPEMLMGALFRCTDLETRFSLNMNVLIDGRVPRVCSLKEVLRAFLDHRREVLKRRSQHRLEKIDARLEILEGFITAFLNLDRVIDINRASFEELLAFKGIGRLYAEKIVRARPFASRSRPTTVVLHSNWAPAASACPASQWSKSGR